MVKLNVSVNWIDTRLTKMNLVDDKGKNILDSGEISKIWIPNLVFKNIADDMRTQATFSSVN